MTKKTHVKTCFKLTFENAEKVVFVKVALHKQETKKMDNSPSWHKTIL